MRTIRFIPLVLCWLALACGSENTDQSKPFDPYFDFSQEILRLEADNPVVEKILTAGGNSEVKSDTLDWTVELKPFEEADINKPSFREQYEQSVETTNGKKQVTYTAKTAELEVRKMVLDYDGDRCVRVAIEKETNIPVYASRQELVYEPGFGYSIRSYQKAAIGYEAELAIEGTFAGVGKPWRVTMDLGGDLLPFNCTYATVDGLPQMSITNDKERINIRDIRLEGDSIFATMPVFDSEIKGIMTEGGMTGFWYNYAKGTDYRIPITAESGVTYRFDPIPENQPKDFSGKWEVYFSPDDEKPCPAIGMFYQEGEYITGTFLTETGDYRFLEGTVHNDTLCLSTFDGSHAFFFKAGLQSDDQLVGYFRSGTHWEEPFEGKRNEEFELRDPESLTFLKDKNQKMDFSFPDTDSNMVSLSDERFKDKVVIIEVMGSWCPNCMDGTSYLTELYEHYHKDGLEIVALAYERSTVFSEARKTVLKHKEDLGAQFDFLIAGKASKAVAAESLPMLNHILSFPTTIFIDRDGMVRKIYTGFQGPGTGHYYEQFDMQTTAFVESLLREQSGSDNNSIARARN